MKEKPSPPWALSQRQANDPYSHSGLHLMAHLSELATSESVTGKGDGGRQVWLTRQTWESYANPVPFGPSWREKIKLHVEHTGRERFKQLNKGH